MTNERSMREALTALSQAMNNPALDWSACESIDVALVYEAARRLKQDEPKATLPPAWIGGHDDTHASPERLIGCPHCRGRIDVTQLNREGSRDG